MYNLTIISRFACSPAKMSKKSFRSIIYWSCHYYSVCSTFKDVHINQQLVSIGNISSFHHLLYSTWSWFSNLTGLCCFPPSLFPSFPPSFSLLLVPLNTYAYMAGCLVWCSYSFCHDACFITLGKTAELFIRYSVISKTHNHQWQWNYKFFIISASLTLIKYEVSDFCRKLMMLWSYSIDANCIMSMWNWNTKKCLHWQSTVFLNTKQHSFN